MTTYGKSLVQSIRDQQQAMNSMTTTFIGDTGAVFQNVSMREPVSPITIVCTSCGAAAGERCNKGLDPRTGAKRWRGYHFRRKDDARLVTAAAQAFGV